MALSHYIRRAQVGLGLLIGITLAAGLTNTATADHPCEQTWHPFTSGGQVGMNTGGVLATTVWNGDLIAGGDFTTAGGQTVNRIARWDGSAWHPLTSGGQIGVNNKVLALTVWNGDLIVGGTFTTAGGQTVNRIARWDGEAWHSFTSGVQTGVDGFGVLALTEWNGNLIAGGFFTTAGGQTVNHIARWDGSAWHPFPSLGLTGLPDEVHALTVWNGDLIAGGIFDSASGGQTVNSIARWDGETWHPFTSGPWTGVSHFVWSLKVWNGSLVVGGDFTHAGSQFVNRIARWDGSAWHPFTSTCGQIGVNGEVRALAVWSGDLIVGGWFTTAGEQTVNRIARWDGSAWRASIAGGETGVNNIVNALTVWNGFPVAAGQFTTAGGQTVNRIATWDGCVPLLGACCINGVALDVPISESSCLAVNGSYQGDFTVPGEVQCAPACIGDLNGDGVVDVSDLLILLGAWGLCP